MGMFCARTAYCYGRLLCRRHVPDGACLMLALRMALAAPVMPIIGLDDAGRSYIMAVAAGAFSAVALAGLYMGYGATHEFVSVGVVCIVLVLLACIDVRVRLLPDALTLPLLWLGLCGAWAGAGIPLHDSVAGVMAGYAILAVPRLGWLWWRRQEGVGAGDVKLLAALGAWVGSSGIVRVLVVACIAGVVAAVVHQRRWRPSGTYPFGPFLALGGLAEFLLVSGVQSWF